MPYAKSKTYTTPRGVAGFVCIFKPSTKFNPAGEYLLDLVLSAEDALPMQELFKAEATAAKATFLDREKDPKKKAVMSKFEIHIPGSEQLDDVGNANGNIVFKFKQAAVVTPKDKSKEPFELKVGAFDAKNKPLPSTTSIGRGTELKVAYEIIPFVMQATKKVGITLRLKAVQVLKLVAYKGGVSAESCGFGVEEDGYTAEDTDAPAFDQPPTTGTGDGSEF